jgi:hypothetical protein
MSDGSEDNFGKKKALKIESIIQMVVDHYVSNEKKFKFRFYELSKGVVVPILIKNNKAEIEHDFDTISRVVSLVPKFKGLLKDKFKDLEILYLTANNAKTVCKTLMYNSAMHYKDHIKTIASKSDECVAFHRLNFDPVEIDLPCPQWDLLLNNFTNANAMKMFIGSLFVEDSDRSQYLWIYGKGGNGKSTIAKVLSKALGDFVRFDQPPGKTDDKYWSYGLLGKRLVVLDDCNNYGFVKTSLFKQATGSSKIRVERKFGDSNDADLTCKFLFTSNEKPNISNDAADQRRIIFSSAKNQESFNYDKDFTKHLQAELDNFLSNCILAYQATCSDGRPIPTDNSEALELAEDFNEDMAAWIESVYEYDQSSSVTIASFLDNLSRSPVRNINKRRIYDFLANNNVAKSRDHYKGRILVGLRQKLFNFSTSINSNSRQDDA